MRKLFLLVFLLPTWVKAADVAVIDLKTPIFAHLNNKYADDFIASAFHSVFIQSGQFSYSWDRIDKNAPFCQLGLGPTVTHNEFYPCTTRMDDSEPIHGHAERSARKLNFQIVTGDYHKCNAEPRRAGFLFDCYANYSGKQRDLMLSDVVNAFGNYVTFKETP